MRVLVTGHKGYIGVLLTKMLVEAGHEVHGLDSDLFRRCTFGSAPLAIPETIKDVRDVTPTDVEGFDALLHLAGLSDDPLGDLDPDLTFEINHCASVRVATLAKDAGVQRFIFSSSCSSYGNGAGDDMLNEDSKLKPVTPYAKSKTLVERDVKKLASDSFTPVFLRHATAYGVSPRIRFDLVLNNLVAWAFCTGEVRLKSDGMSWRPIVHIEDISRAFLAALSAPQEVVHNKVFNVGVPGENFRIREIAAIVQETVAGSKVTFAPDASPDKRSYRVDCTRLPELVPSFQPQWTCRKGARELYEAYKQIGLALEDFEGERFKRLAHIRMLMGRDLVDRTLRVRREFS